MSLPATQMRPESGFSSLSRRRMRVDFPEPVGPTRKTNSCLAMSSDSPLSAVTLPLYTLVTLRSRIMGAQSWEYGLALPG